MRTRLPSWLLATLATLLLASGCGAAASQQRSAIDRAEVVMSASFDHDCPPAEIRVLESAQGEGPGTRRFLLDVCGRRRVYKGVGTIFFEAPAPGESTQAVDEWTGRPQRTTRIAWR
jgi:hypothetical protein